MDHTETASVRYMIDDVPAAIVFYTEHLGFTLETDASPAFASVVRGPLRLLLSGARKPGGAANAGWQQTGTRRMDSHPGAGGRHRE